MVRRRALLSVLVPAALLSAPAGAHDERDGFIVDPRVSTDFATVRTGLRLGAEVAWQSVLFSGFLDSEFSPLPNGTHVTLHESRTYVIRDAWYAVGPGMGLTRPLTEAVSVAGAWGASRVVGLVDAASWTPWLDAGFRVAGIDHSYWGLFYQYRPMPVETDHRIAFQLRLRLI
jgi:hypothetical protein